MTLYITPNLQSIRKNGKILIYDSKSGQNLKINEDALAIINMINTGISIEEIKNTYDVSNLELLVDVLKKKKLAFELKEEYKDFKFITNIEEVKEGRGLRHLRLNITERCNLDCGYCYERESNFFAKKRVMTSKMAIKVIDTFMDVTSRNKQKRVSVRFFGGEPLLNWSVIVDSINRVKEIKDEDMEVDYILNTNGTIIDDKIAEFLAGENVSISLSLDGVEKYHDITRKYINGKGSFSIIDKNIDILAKHKCQFTISVVCTDNSYPHLKELIDYLKEKEEKLNYKMAVCFNNIQICDRHGIIKMNTEKKVEYLIEAIRYSKERGIYSFGGLTHFVFQKLAEGYVGRHCSGLGGEISVDPDGDICPCSGIGIKLGNINNIEEIFLKKEYIELMTRTAGTIEECKGCCIEGFCAGGCYAELLSDSGKEKGEYRDCDLQIKTFEALVKEYVLSDC